MRKIKPECYSIKFVQNKPHSNLNYIQYTNRNVTQRVNVNAPSDGAGAKAGGGGNMSVE